MLAHAPSVTVTYDYLSNKEKKSLVMYVKISDYDFIYLEGAKRFAI